MEDSFGLFVSLVIGILCILRFKSFGEYVVKRNILAKYVPLPGKKWTILFAQFMFLVTGIIFVILSLTKLLPMLF